MPEKPCHQQDGKGQGRDRPAAHRRRRQRDQRDIHREDADDDGAVAQAPAQGQVIEVLAMGAPDFEPRKARLIRVTVASAR